MMIIRKHLIEASLFIPELATKFKVKKVEWELAESTWWLQYEDYPEFMAYEKSGLTQKDDEQIQEIIAHITISSDGVEFSAKREKEFVSNKGWANLTGVFTDEIKSSDEEQDERLKNAVEYKLDSVFPLEITGIPEGAKVGDWISISGEVEINLPR